MGKASRMKKYQRSMWDGHPGWQQEASRQAKERRREEVERHNAEQAERQFKDISDDGENVSLFADGQLHVGKKAVSEVYTSWVRNEIKIDQVIHLDEIAELGPHMKTSIWDTTVEVLDLDDGGAKRLLDPLRGTYVLEKECCFEWLARHASESVEGTGVLASFIGQIIPMLDHMEAASIRFKLAKLAIAKFTEYWLGEDDGEVLTDINRMVSFSSVGTEVFQRTVAKWHAKKEREAIEGALAAAAEPIDCEPNPEAIHLAGEALAAASESSKQKPASQALAAGRGPLRM